jgi:outer membrane protein assembly factor BamB
MIVMGACMTGNNTVIFGNLEGDIYALNKSGHLLWTYKTEGRVNTPAIGKKFFIFSMTLHVFNLV